MFFPCVCVCVREREREREREKKCPLLVAFESYELVSATCHLAVDSAH